MLYIYLNVYIQNEFSGIENGMYLLGLEIRLCLTFRKCLHRNMFVRIFKIHSIRSLMIYSRHARNISAIVR